MAYSSFTVCFLLFMHLLAAGFAQLSAEKSFDDMIGQPEGEDSMPTDPVIPAKPSEGQSEGEDVLEGEPEGEETSFPQDSMTAPFEKRTSDALSPAEEPAVEDGDGGDLSEKEALASLEEAQLYMQRARVVDTTPECQASLNWANGELAWCITFLLASRFNDTLEKLGDAKKSLLKCSAALSTDTGDSTKPLAYLVQKVLSEIDEANITVSELATRGPVDTQPEPEPEPETEPVFQGVAARGSCSKVDGTTCQFSNCGSGKNLPKCAVGFAGGVTGGAGGVHYTVTNSDDNPLRPQRGSFRYGVQLANKKNGGVWITFARSMTIELKDMVWIRSSTTVDGRGVDVTFTNKCLVLAGVSNVILHNFEISRVPQTDTIHIFGGSKKVWVDHITSSNAKLGLVSVVQASTDVTISNCYLSNKNFNMLLGASDTDSQDKNMRVTVFRNWFRDSMQRMPHCRWGYCHVVNNLYTNWGYYAIGGRANAQILSEANAFIPGRRREVTPWFPGAAGALDQSSTIESRNDLYLGGSTFHEFVTVGKNSKHAPKYASSSYKPPVLPSTRLVKMIQKCAGSLFGSKVQRCMFSL